VLEHHYPNTPNFGDMTQFKEWPNDPIDLLVGGTPCQSFSIAGLRKGLDDPRGNLMLTYLAIAERYAPRWIVWENVPGVLSSNGGRDFGTFLAALGKIGYGFAYRVLDAQYFGVAQRRRRVFVVGYLGDWRRAAAVLFERESLSGHPAPSRKSRKDAAGYTATSLGKYSEGVGTETLPVTTGSLCARTGQSISVQDASQGHLLPIAFSSNMSNPDYQTDGSTPAIKVGGHGGGNPPAVAWSIMPMNSGKDYKARVTDVAQLLMAGGPVGGNQGGDFVQQVAPAIAFGRGVPTTGFQGDRAYAPGDVWGSLSAQGGNNGGGAGGLLVAPAVALDMRGREGGAMMEGPHDTANIRAASGGSSRSYVLNQMAVRRLTPRECERLQGFPDDYTLVPHRNKPAADGPRYKAMGNSMAVPVMRWIGERIQMVDELMEDKE
jgi:DNA (cytosine-5)-methyltransferase 1